MVAACVGDVDVVQHQDVEVGIEVEPGAEALHAGDPAAARVAVAQLLGLPPAWYKSFAYRSRAVSEPRGVLAEFGVNLPADTEVRVWDSTAELRYLVMPQRPAGTEDLDEAALMELVTRNGMIGTALA